jgi:signal transduction histidine kinase
MGGRGQTETNGPTGLAPQALARTGRADAAPWGPQWLHTLRNFLTEHLSNAHPERLIAAGRLVSASFALLAIYLDPTHPARNVSEVYAILAVYLVYSTFLAAVSSQRPLDDRLHYVTHAIDIVVLGLLAFLTEELVSPFFAFFTFALITGAMRWGLLGAVATALIMVGLLVAVGWPLDEPGQYYVNVLVMRSVYALVAAVLLGYFAAYREYSRKRLMQLAAWPANTAEDKDRWLESSLGHASEVLGGVRLLVAWIEVEEPVGRFVLWQGADGTFHEVPGNECRDLIAAGEQRASFAYGQLREVLALPRSFEWLVADELFAAPAPSGRSWPALCSARFTSPHYDGRLFVLDPGYPNEDILSLTEIVASRILAELEQLSMMRELAAAAGWRERGRLARDLHDSVLQDLTAAGLQLKAAARGRMDALPAKIDEVTALLAAQQRRIRNFVENARPSPSGSVSAVHEQLLAFAQALGNQWQCAVTADVDPAEMTLPNRIVSEICQLASEATANAVRHGGANHVVLSIRKRKGTVNMRIEDDGRGAPDLENPHAMQPLSIRERVRDLGGDVRILPSSTGLHIAVSLPF